jgi:hypothetical protein
VKEEVPKLSLNYQNRPPIKLQETKSSDSLPFTLRPKAKSRCNLKCLLFDKGDKLSKEVWVGWDWKPKLWSRDRRFLFVKRSIIGKILAVRLEGLFWTRNKVGCSFGFGLWAWPSKTSHYDYPSRETVGVHGQKFGLWT